MNFFDTHSHYNDSRFAEDLEEIIEQTKVQGITKFVCAGYNIESSKLAIELAKKYDFIYAVCGISPNDVPESEEEIQNLLIELKELVNSNKKYVIAIGEIGLDYYWNKENKDLQKTLFIEQIKFANEVNLPIQIHTREAIDDTLNILRNVQKPVKPGIFHCCPLNRELVKQALEIGFYISFAGPVTFKNSKNAEEIANMVPMEKMLIETDSPYLAPEPVRGTRNNSINVKHIAEKIANLRNVTIEEVANTTYNNAITVFNIL